MTPQRLSLLAATLALCSLTALAGDAPDVVGDPPQEQGPSYQWEEGPKSVVLGNDLAEVSLQDSETYLNAKESQRLLRDMGNIINGTEVGLVAPRSQDESWFVVFEYEAVGYVKDDEKDSIDADALLESIKEGTEAANKERAELGRPGLHVVGWAEPPHYDAASHNLVWGILARSDDGREIINYNVRVLGRGGVMSATLVDAPERIEAAKPAMASLLTRFDYRPGKRYAEWREGDKVAAYGLTALVAAGAGAAAVKTGLLAKLLQILAKAGKAVFLFAAALLAGVAKFLKALFGRKDAGSDVNLPPAA